MTFIFMIRHREYLSRSRLKRIESEALRRERLQLVVVEGRSNWHFQDKKL